MAKSISKNAIFKAMLNLFNIILPILVIPLVTRSVGKELYGYMGYGDSLTAYFFNIRKLWNLPVWTKRNK
ncbi:O-antigen/teichoic acid export membrane protein [Clostridium beijerinckii]|nr:O-antigen/teichoic acid export membrane protein [Clostridium beijerinckii]